MATLRHPSDPLSINDIVEIVVPHGDTDTVYTVSDRAGTLEVLPFKHTDGSWAVRVRARVSGRGAVSEREATEPIATFDVCEAVVGPAPLARTATITNGVARLSTIDGRPFLWIGDTWWLGLSGRLTDDEFAELATLRAGQGFSIIQLVAGLYPDVDWRDDCVALSGVAPLDVENRPDPRWFDAADHRVATLVRTGIVPCIFGLWGYHLGFIGFDAVSRLWREIVARWSAFPVVWTIAGEASLPWYDLLGTDEIDIVVKGQLEEVRRLAGYVRGIDTYRNPVSVHPSPGTGYVSSLDQFEEHLDLTMLQTGHRGSWDMSTAQNALGQARAHRPQVPVVNAEASYEGILGSSWHPDQRWQAWSQLLNGAAGFTYGAQGLWRFDRGINDTIQAHTGSWGEYRWQDAARFEGGRQVGLAGRLLREWGIEDYRPASGALVTSQPLTLPVAPAVVCRPDTSLIAYFPPVAVLPASPGTVSRAFSRWFIRDLEPGSAYRYCVVDPRTGDRRTDLVVAANDQGVWGPEPGFLTALPSMEDWIVLLTRLE